MKLGYVAAFCAGVAVSASLDRLIDEPRVRIEHGEVRVAPVKPEYVVVDKMISNTGIQHVYAPKSEARYVEMAFAEWCKGEVSESVEVRFAEWRKITGMDYPRVIDEDTFGYLVRAEHFKNK